MNLEAALSGQVWYTATRLAVWRKLCGKLTILPIVPVIAGGAGVYTVREEDLMRAIALLVSATTLEPGTISIAHPSRVTLKNLTENLRSARKPPVPVRPCALALVYWLLRSGELMRCICRSAPTGWA